MQNMSEVCIYWFRKGLRLHDNPALMSCIAQCKGNTCLVPIFILDPWFVKHGNVGRNRWKFLQETLQDLTTRLESIGSRFDLNFLAGICSVSLIWYLNKVVILGYTL